MKSSKHAVDNDDKNENVLITASYLLRNEFEKLDEIIKSFGRNITKWTDFFKKSDYAKDINFTSTLAKLNLRDKQATAIRKFIEYYEALQAHYLDDHITNNSIDTAIKSDISKNRNGLFERKEKQLLSLLATNKTTSLDQFIESLDDSITMVRALTQLNITSKKNEYHLDIAALGKDTYKEGCKVGYKLLKNHDHDDCVFLADSLKAAEGAIKNHETVKAAPFVERIATQVNQVSGRPSRRKFWSGFVKALAGLAGAIILGLTIAGIPVSAGLSSLAAPLGYALLAFSGVVTIAGVVGMYKGTRRGYSEKLNRLKEKSYELLNKLPQDKLKNKVDENKSVNDEKVEVHIAIDIPHVIDCKHLGDKENGHLISDAGCRLLDLATKDLGIGRYSKKDIRERVGNQLQQKEEKLNIDDIFPYLPGIDIEPGCTIKIAANDPREDKAVLKNQLYVFIKKDELYYFIENDSGRYLGKIEKQQLTDDVYQNIYQQAENIARIKINDPAKGRPTYIQQDKDQVAFKGLYNIALQNGHVVNRVIAIYLGLGKEEQKGEKEELGKSLGKGGFGKAKVGFDIHHKKYKVDKVFTEVVNSDPHQIKDEKKEHSALIDARHEGEISKRLNRSQGVPMHRLSSKDNVMKYHLIIDFVEGRNLRDYLNLNPYLSTDCLLNIAIQMIAEVNHLHKEGYLHRDVINPRNFMYNPMTGKVTLIDFGLTEKLEENNSLTVKYREVKNDYPPEIKPNQKSQYSIATETFFLSKTMEMFLERIYERDENIKKIIDKMQYQNPEDRIPLEKAQEELMKIRKVHEFSNFKKIGILNIDDYIKETDPNKIFAMNEALLLMDSVVLVADKKSLTPIDYNEIRNKLLRAGVSAENKMFFSDNPDSLMTNIKSEHENTLISYYFIHNTKPPFNHPEVRSIQANTNKTVYSYSKEMLSESPLVSQKDLLKVKTALVRTLELYMEEKSIQKVNGNAVLKERAGFFARNRLSSSSKAISSRIANIEAFIAHIDKASKDTTSKITYVSLVDSLTKLEYDLGKNKFRAPESAKKVKEAIIKINNPTKRLVM